MSIYEPIQCGYEITEVSPRTIWIKIYVLIKILAQPFRRFVKSEKVYALIIEASPSGYGKIVNICNKHYIVSDIGKNVSLHFALTSIKYFVL